MTRVRQRSLALAATAAVLALTAAGCGGDDRNEASTTNTTPAPVQSTTPKSAEPGIAVTEREFSIAPKNVEVPKAGTVTFTIKNAGGTEHALEVEGPNGEKETDAIAPGASTTLKVRLDKPGRYEWYCPIDDHKGKGMRGTIVVAGGGPSGDDDSSGKDDSSGHGGGSKGDDSGGSGSNDDSAGGSGSGGGNGDDSGGSGGDSGGIGPSNDSGGYMPG